MERLVVSGVTYNRNEAKIRVSGVKDVPGVAAKLFGPLSDAGIVVDMIVQNVSQDGTTDMTFTVPREDGSARARDHAARWRRSSAARASRPTRPSRRSRSWASA